MPNSFPDFIQSLFSPLSFQGFLETTFTKKLLISKGDANRFADRCSLELLLGALQDPRLMPERVTLVQDGDPINPSQFVTMGSNTGVPQLNFSQVEQLLSQNAALLLTQAHELLEPLATLSHELTQAFAEPVNINIYFGGPNSKGFPAHVDHHDVLVFQVLGRKRWTIHEPTLIDPILLPEHLTEPPTGEPAWEGDLCAGDVLYLPRGFWHSAQGTAGSGTLHLACGIQPLSGLHFLTWLRRELMGTPIFRKSLPVYDGADDGDQYVRHLQEALNSALTRDMLERFIQEHRQRILKESKSNDPTRGDGDNENLRNQ